MELSGGGRGPRLNAAERAELMAVLEDREEYNYLADLTIQDVHETVAQVVADVVRVVGTLAPEVEAQYIKKLRGYRFVQNLQALRRGTFVRWIRADDGYLTRGGVLFDYEPSANGMVLLVKGMGGAIFRFLMNTAYVFQKLSVTEELIFRANAAGAVAR